MKTRLYVLLASLALLSAGSAAAQSGYIDSVHVDATNGNIAIVLQGSPKYYNLPHGSIRSPMVLSIALSSKAAGRWVYLSYDNEVGNNRNLTSIRN